MITLKPKYDVVILGAGHNGLVAASYLGRAGLSVLLLEKNDYVGGATTSQRLFPDYDARLSRYAYLVSLLPQKIIRDLGLNLELRRRAIGSCTPYVSHGQHGALVLSNLEEEVSRKSIVDLTGNDAEFERLKNFYNLPRVFAEQIWDSMLEPLVAKQEMARRFDVDETSREAWRSLVEEPLATRLSVIYATTWCAGLFSLMQRLACSRIRTIPRWCRTVVFFITSSETRQANGRCRSAGWARCRPNWNAQRVNRAPKY